jgi:hypothetical protein
MAMPGRRGDEDGAPLRYDRERADDTGYLPWQVAAALAFGIASLGGVLTMRQVLLDPVTPVELSPSDPPALALTLAAAVGVRLWLRAAALAKLGGQPRYRLVWRAWPPLLRVFAHDHGRRYRRNQMLGVRALSLTPAVGLLAATAAAPPRIWLWTAAALVTASAAMDLRTLARLLKVASAALIEDHKDGWIAWPPSTPPTGPGPLRVVRVADLPWPRSLRRCAHRGRLRRAIGASPLSRFLSSSRHQATSRSTSQAVLSGFGRDDFAACPFHRADWQRIADAAVALARGEDPGTLPVREARWLASLLEDPIAWDQGSTRLDNGQHRVCALRAAGVDLCVAAGLTLPAQPGAPIPDGKEADRPTEPEVTQPPAIPGPAIRPCLTDLVPVTKGRE